MGKRNNEDFLTVKKIKEPEKKLEPSLKQVKIENMFQIKNDFSNIDFTSSPPEIVFLKLLETQKKSKFYSSKNKMKILEENLSELKVPISQIAKHIDSLLRKFFGSERKAKLRNTEKVVNLCLLLRTGESLENNACWSDVYSPKCYDHLFSNNRMPQIEEHLHSFFYNSSQFSQNHFSEMPLDRRRQNPFLDSMRSQSGLRFLSQRSRFSEYFGLDLGDEMKQNMMLLLGPESSGKFSNLKVFASKCCYEREVIDFTLQNNLLSIKKKFLYAVGTNDVKVNLMDQFEKEKKKDKRPSESDSPKLDLFFKKTEKKSSQWDSNFETESRIQTMLKKHSKRKLFICRNLDFLYDINRFENKKRFEKKFSEFFTFVKKSKYPFVFISSDEIKCSKIFGQNIDYLKIIEMPSPEKEEVVQLLTVVVFVERMFHLFLKLGKSKPKLENFFNVSKSKIVTLREEAPKFKENVPDLEVISRFVFDEKVNINWTLQKAFLFRKCFFRKNLTYFDKKQMSVNSHLQNQTNLLRTFPKKPSNLKGSVLEERVKFLLRETSSLDSQQVEDFKKTLYKRLKSKQAKMTKAASPSPLLYLNPCLKFLGKTKRKKKQQTKLNHLRKCLDLRTLTNNCRRKLSETCQDYDHLQVECRPPLVRFSEPCLELEEVWSKGEKGAKVDKQKMVGYFLSFEEDESEIEKLEKSIRVYNQMFRKQVPLAFLQNSQLRFDTFEVDLFKQVILFSDR